MELKSFFTDREIRTSIDNFAKKISNTDTVNDFEKEKIYHLLHTINLIRKNSAEWDTHCQANISWIGDKYYQQLVTSGAERGELLDLIFSSTYRFLVEMEISSGLDSLEINALHTFVSSNLPHFSPKAVVQINFADNQMPIGILKLLFSSEHVQSIKNIAKLKEDEKTSEERWNTEISEREKKVNTIKQTLDKYETAFNFVGLYSGFDKLANEKKSEKENATFWLKIFGPLILLPSTIELTIILTHIGEIDKIQNTLVTSAIPAISLTLLIIYFFRIFLSNYNSIKSQLLQIDLRMTLCAFIQDYANYSSEIKSKDKEALEKFENIIFSGLVGDNDKIPSTFDGMEQISSFIKSIKN